MRERIEDALKASMKVADKSDQDRMRLSTLRLMSAAIKDRDIAARSEDRCEGVSSDEILGILTKMVKQREESSKSFEAGGRPELAEQERFEIEVIQEFLPRQMEASEVEKAVNDVVVEFEASSLKDMGKCMGVLKERHQGAMNFGSASKILKELLASS